MKGSRYRKSFIGILQYYADIKIELIALKIEDNWEILKKIGRQVVLKVTR